MNFTGGTANIVGEGFEFLEGTYENIIGMSREEQIADGKKHFICCFRKIL